MPNHKPREVTLIRPNKQGELLISIKPRPNAPCQCKSGKKQKHCCGRKSKVLSIDPKAITQPTPPEDKENGQ
ncbi:MAG: hypothetical protein ACOYN4_00390 [Bacteroidales bacterium]